MSGSSSDGTKPPSRPSIMSSGNRLGEASTPGQKTPRKVQWLDENKRDSPIHALDEHGLDPNALDYFTDALVRHQSQSQPQGRPQPHLDYKSASSQVSSPSPDPATTRNTAANAATGIKSGPRIHYFPARPAQPPALSTTELTPFERDASSPGKNALTATSDDASPNSAGTVGAHDVPGTYIDPNENAGLPGPTDAQYREAANIVRAHTRSRARGRGFFLNLAGIRSRQERSRSGERDDGRERDEEKEAAPANPRLTQGGGVLGALLTLYNQEQGLTSGMSTPAEELPERPWIDRAKAKSPASVVDFSRPSTPSNSTPGSPKQREKEMLLKRSNSVNSNLNRSFGRPKNERNGAGVFGNLIASTGNITGVAAPTPSQLAPNVKRPGYHLSRYSLESKLTTIKHPEPAAMERPRSTNFDNKEIVEMRTIPASPSNETLATLVGAPGPHDKEKGLSLQKSPTPGSIPTHKSKWSGVLKDFPYANSVISLGRQTPSHTPINTPSVEGDDPFNHPGYQTADRKERERRKRKKAEIYITRHVAEIIQRQEFILKLARAMMMFGAPSHRLQSQIAATGRVLGIEVSCMYLPDVMLISFDDTSTGTSSIRFIRQGSALDLGKLSDAYELYWKVIHDELAVADASAQLTSLMKKPQIYPWWALMMIGGMCSSAICTVSFKGSFIDAVAVWPLGALLVGLQLLSVKNELYSNVFEIVVAGLFSFIAGGMAASNKLCYSAIASSSVVLILPGFIVLCGSLEIMSRNIVSGSVRMFYAVIYSLFLGFGLAIGAEAYQKITSHDIVGITDYSCERSHDPEGPWWQRSPSLWWAFLTVPMFSTFLSLRNHVPYKRKELALLVGIASIGWVTNHFTGTKFVNQSDISAGVGAFAVGFVANMYGRFFDGNAFVIMITGILFQVPSGLGAGGLLAFVSEQSSGSSTSYISGFQTALQLVSVAIGLTVGLGLALLVVHPIPSRKRGGGVFSL